MCRRKWFRQIIPRAGAHHLDAGCDAWTAGNDNDNGVAVSGHSGAQHVESGDRPEIEIGKDDVKMRPPQDLDGFTARSGGDHIVSLKTQRARQSFAKSALIFDNEYPDACLYFTWY